MDALLREQDELFYATFPAARRRPSQAEIEAKHAQLYAPTAPPAALAMYSPEGCYPPSLFGPAVSASIAAVDYADPAAFYTYPPLNSWAFFGQQPPCPPPSAAPPRLMMALPSDAASPVYDYGATPVTPVSASTAYSIDTYEGEQYASPQDLSPPYAAPPAVFSPGLALGPPSVTSTVTPPTPPPPPAPTTTTAAAPAPKRKAPPKRYNGYYPASPLRSSVLALAAAESESPPSASTDTDTIEIKQEDLDDEDRPSPPKRPRHSLSLSSASTSTSSHSPSTHTHTSHSRSPSVSVSPTAASHPASSKGKGKAAGAGANGEAGKGAGKKDAPKKPPLACLFCRGRKIACGPPSSKDGGSGSGKEGAPQGACNQCQRRAIKCEYPTESRRGMRKKKPPVAVVAPEGDGQGEGSANAAASTSGSSTATLGSAPDADAFVPVGDASGSFSFDADPGAGLTMVDASGAFGGEFVGEAPMASLPSPSAFDFAGAPMSVPISPISPTSALAHSLSATSLSAALSVPVPGDAMPPSMMGANASVSAGRTRDPRLASSVRDAGGGARV